MSWICFPPTKKDACRQTFSAASFTFDIDKRTYTRSSASYPTPCSRHKYMTKYATLNSRGSLRSTDFRVGSSKPFRHSLRQILSYSYTYTKILIIFQYKYREPLPTRATSSNLHLVSKDQLEYMSSFHSTTADYGSMGLKRDGKGENINTFP